MGDDPQSSKISKLNEDVGGRESNLGGTELSLVSREGTEEEERRGEGVDDDVEEKESPDAVAVGVGVSILLP